jgi:hypothetical protein
MDDHHQDEPQRDHAHQCTSKELEGAADLTNHDPMAADWRPHQEDK